MMNEMNQNEYNLFNPSPSKWAIFRGNKVLYSDIQVLGEGWKLFLNSLALIKKN